jgi:predicted esterase
MTTERAPVPFLTSREAVRVTRDVAYAEAGVGFVSGKGASAHRQLRLDIYEPETHSGPPRPALVLAFGGAFHRGSKETDEFGDQDGMSTPVAEYCRLFAERGYVCFCIDYRLTQEKPDPGFTPVLLPGEAMNKDRVNVVRGMLGLPPATDEELANGIEGATDDMVKAISFVRSRSRAYGVDISRIAIGGFSAGAVISLYAAFVERAPVAAVVSLSGRISKAGREIGMTGAPDEPAVLMFVGERDLPVIAEEADDTEAHMTRVGLRQNLIRLAGATHFYPKSTPIPAVRGLAADDVETAIAAFLYETLRLKQIA